MKQLKLFGLIVLLALFSSTLFAEELKIKVTALGNPLGHSYVYINGEVTVFADANGIAYLPIKWLNLGDIISASFVGFDGAETVFNSENQQTKEVTLNLSSDFTLDEIVVRADVSKIYKKYIERHFIVFRNRVFKMKFDITDHQQDSIKLISKGIISLIHDYWQASDNYVYRHTRFKAKGDTTGVINIIATIHSSHLSNCNLYDRAFREEFNGNETLTITPLLGYMGVIDNYRVFTQSYKSETHVAQYIYYFDRKKGTIKRVMYNLLNHTENKEITEQFSAEYDIGNLRGIQSITKYHGTAKSAKMSTTNIVRLYNFSTRNVFKISPDEFIIIPK